jgi:hypothetical protein
MGMKLSKNWLVVCFVLFLLVAININRLLPYPQAKDLLIDMTPFLPNWKIRGEGVQTIPQGPLGGRRTIHTATITYESVEGSFTQDIYQFKSCSNSKKYYSREVWKLNSMQNSDRGLVSLSETENGSAVATHSYLSCKQTTFSPTMTGCSYVAQYGVYVVSIQGGWLDSSQVSEKTLREVLKEVDSIMSSWYGVCIAG